MEYEYPEHSHPHGINHPENPHRIWVCQDCDHFFADEEIRRDIADGLLVHTCKCHPVRKGQFCESHLESYMPSPLMATLEQIQQVIFKYYPQCHDLKRTWDAAREIFDITGRQKTADSTSGSVQHWLA